MKTWQKLVSSIFLLVVLFLVFPKEADAYFGYNVHSLAKENPENISRILNYLASNCETTIVRLWGYESTFGIQGYDNLQKVLDAAPSNIKFIVALEDFPYGPPESNPGAWYSNGYRTRYRDYVARMLDRYGNSEKILIWEMVNEPHCKGDSSCLSSLVDFINDMSNLMASKTSAYISPGLMTSQIPLDTYEFITNLQNITANSCHYYNESNTKGSCLDAANIVKGAGKFYYIGEAGYKASGSGGSGSCTSADCTNVCGLQPLQQRYDQVQADRSQLTGTGADAFILWQFSPQRNPLLICDRFSVFPEDPLCGGEGLDLIPTDVGEDMDEILDVNQETAYGRRVYGRGIPCGPLRSWPATGEEEVQTYYDISEWENQYQAANGFPQHPYDAMDFVPYDWSPERPFVGDNCYPLEYTTKTDYNIEYCAEQPVGTDKIKYFIQPPSEIIDYLEVADLHMTSLQIPFLGISRASSNYMWDKEDRMQNFLTSYLRGELYFDRTWVDSEDVTPEMLERETGVIRKLYPRDWMYSGDIANKWKEKDMIIDRLLKATFQEYESELEGPIHDYPLIYKNASGDFLSEDDFKETFPSGLPDRKSYEDVWPVRISQLVCQNSNILVDYGYDQHPACQQGTNWLADSGSHEDEGLLYQELWPKYFPIASKEDAKVIVDFSMPDDNEARNINDVPIKNQRFFDMSLNEQKQILEQYNGQYVTRGGDGLMRHRVEEIFVPYIAEMEDLSDWVFKTAISEERQKEARDNEYADSSIDNVKLPSDDECKLDEARGGIADPVAVNYQNYLHDTNDPTVPIRREDMWVWVLNEVEADKSTKEPTYCAPDPCDPTFQDCSNDCVSPNKETEKSKGKIETKFPLLNTVASRLIGEKYGAFNIFFTDEQLNTIKTKISEKVDNKVNPLELPAEGKSKFDWVEQSGISTKSDGKMCDEYCEGNRDVKSVDSSGKEVDFYFPYVGSLQIFRQLISRQLLPYGYELATADAQSVDYDTSGRELGSCQAVDIPDMAPMSENAIAQAAVSDDEARVLGGILYVESAHAYQTGDSTHCPVSPCGAVGWFQIVCGWENVNCDPSKGAICDAYCSNGQVQNKNAFACPAGITDPQQLCDPNTAAEEAIKKIRGKMGKSSGESWTADEAGEAAARYFGESASIANCSDGQEWSRLGNCTYCEFVREYFNSY